MGINTSAVQRLYLAYFNRPSDPLGQAHWESQLSSTVPATQAQLTALAGGFSGSAEYAALYAGQTNEARVNNLYLNLFGRNAETAGLAYWSGRLTAGTETFASIALQLTFSAQGADATVIANRLTFSTAFTTALDTVAEITGYSGMASAASARSWLAGVTDSALTLSVALNSVNQAVASVTGTGVIITPPIIPPVIPPVTGSDLAPGTLGLPDDGSNLIEGSNGDDILVGDNGRNLIDGLRGNDTLDGAGGDDYLSGGPGRDILTSGAGNDIVSFLNREAASGVNVGVALTSFAGIDRITDFNGNGNLLGDRIQLGTIVGYFDQNFSFQNVNKGIVTQVTVQNNASNFTNMLALIQQASPGVASTNTLVQFYDVNITAGNGTYNGGAPDRVLIFNDSTAQINAFDTFIGLQIGGVPVVPNDIFFQ